MKFLRISGVGRAARTRTAGFTLVEVLVAVAILLIVILVLLQVIAGMTKMWQTTSGTVSDFQSARIAFTTLNRVLGRATLHTYLDYINDPTANNPPYGLFRTTGSSAAATSFVPAGFARKSELHFVAGPAIDLLGQASQASLFPGDAVFFQAPLGFTNDSDYQPLSKMLNNVGFYIQYEQPPATSLPAWLNTVLGLNAPYRFRLIEAIQPTESMNLYPLTSSSTYTGVYNALQWLPTTPKTTLAPSSSTYISSVLAENVLLLIIRPRMDPQDELTMAPTLGMSYSATTEKSILCPDYNYDSRAWEPGYPANTRVLSDPNSPTGHALLMRNQLPPIVDVAMVCTTNESLARFQNPTTPPAAVLVPASLFTNSANLDEDLATYGAQLSNAHLRYRIFRSSVRMESAAWSDN